MTGASPWCYLSPMVSIPQEETMTAHDDDVNKAATESENVNTHLTRQGSILTCIRPFWRDLVLVSKLRFMFWDRFQIIIVIFFVLIIMAHSSIQVKGYENLQSSPIWRRLCKTQFIVGQAKYRRGGFSLGESKPPWNKATPPRSTELVEDL